MGYSLALSTLTGHLFSQVAVQVYVRYITYTKDNQEGKSSVNDSGLSMAQWSLFICANNWKSIVHTYKER